MGNICSALKPPKKVRGKEKYLFLKMDNVFPENVVVCKELSNISNVRLLLIMTYQQLADLATHTLAQGRFSHLMSKRYFLEIPAEMITTGAFGPVLKQQDVLCAEQNN